MATLITKNSSTASAVPAAGDLVKGELAVNVTDKKVYTKDNSAAVVKLVGSLGNQEANAVVITGGTINGTTIGATTPSTGAFTTASASSGFTGNLTGNVTGNVSGTAANVTGVVAIANGGTGLSALGTGVQSALGQTVTGSGSFVLSTSPSLTTPNLGTPSVAVLTNATGLPLTTGVTGTLGVANGGTGITAFGTGVATALGQNVTGSGGIVLATSPSLTTPNLGTPSAVTLTNATGLPISTGVSGLGTGVATALAVNTGSSGAFIVNGGALGTPSSGTLTNATGLPLSTGVTGTLATTNGGTGLTSFTANGVIYASSSSALTTGSALVFDGTNLGLGTNAPGSYAGYSVATINGTNGGVLQLKNTGNTNSFEMATASGATYIKTVTASDMWFGINNSEAMRLTSTSLYTASGINVGIGTSNTSNGRLNVQAGTSATGNSGFFTNIDGTNNPYVQIQHSSAGTKLFASSSSGGAASNLTLATPGGSAVLDSSGNLGLGVTPSAWNITALQVKNGSMYGAGSTEAGWYSNAYYNSGWKYISNGASAGYVQNGNHQWFVAGSGTAGNAISFTQALTLAASGNLLVGPTSDAGYRIDALIGAGSGSVVRFGQSGVSNGYTITSNGSALTHDWANGGSVAMTLNSTGTLFIANASTVPSSNPSGGGLLYVEGGALKYRGSSGTVTTIANA